ncbi:MULTISPECIES: DUF262 domain-containing protein [Hyphomonas]|uniref:GmrSD restriction endonucleases N-terminal domain-containing protein n=1 Tax=Hyphomonas atlantica TaxID=1280948 RepID=A0A059DYF9_9PROT|nr:MULTISPECIES: DUF262 domain-containing protein [Hyphomonas]KCZ58567.1 hypothetical protein HY36_09320 [Hyphomonas atlantica]MAM06825.1 DUF262 domain-containing protein [Hyphomonas sp.]|tara:strand:- start:47 stop:1099 length:1053 start_codon:yes stop_codon:yes gene_type:complete
MNIVTSSKRIHEIIKDVQDGSLVPKPAFQRRKVWSQKDKARLIDTILLGYPFPEIYFCNGEIDTATGKGTTMIVDGQQRVSTIVEYFSDSSDFKLPPDLPPYKDLTDSQKRAFLEYPVVVRNLGDTPLKEIVEIFRRINITSYNLNAMEINNAIYDGPLKTFAEQLVLNDIFATRRFFKPAQLKRMGDVRYALTLIITMMQGYFNRDDRLQEYLEIYNDEFPHEAEIRNRFENVVEFIESCGFAETSKVWQQNNLLNVIVELDKLLNLEAIQLNPNLVYERLDDFFLTLDSTRMFENSRMAQAFDRASVQAANDRKNRIRRGEILRAIIIGEEIETNIRTKDDSTLPLFD